LAIPSLVFVLMLGCRGIVRAGSPAFWLGGEDPVVQHDKHKEHPADYMDLFKADSPWPVAASGLTAFKISTQFVLRGDEGQLRIVMRELRQRHISLAIEMGVLEGRGPGNCGYHVEGYASPRTVEAVARKIKKLGGQIDLIAMDEPVWYGHIFRTGSGDRVGCQSSVEEVAEIAASKVRLLRQYFPDIQVGDIEPVNARLGGQRSIDDIIEFVGLLNEKVPGSPVFLHADISWGTDWQPLLEDLATRLHAKGIHVGVIFDGDADAEGDEAWVRQALERCKNVAGDPKIDPDDFIIQSWEVLPTKMLPETDPGTLTFETKQIEALFR
jgi:hypothetical protein